MHVLIDLERMVAVYKHPNPGVLDALATIELSHRPNRIIHLEGAGAVQLFTDYELQKLYENLTGEKLPGFLRTQNVAMLYDALLRLPVCSVVVNEVFAQAQSIASDDSELYVYARGSNRPALMQDLWEPEALRVVPSNPAAQLPERAAAPLPVAPDRQRAPTTPRAAAPRSTSGPKTSIIWEVADALWNAAGKPTDLKTVLAIRKQAMDKLEQEHDVKRTTSSSSLGGWQKDRLKI